MPVNYAIVSGLSKFAAADARHNLDGCGAFHVYLYGHLYPPICRRSAGNRSRIFPQCAGDGFVDAAHYADGQIKHPNAETKIIFSARPD